MPASNDFFTPKSSYDLDELVECGYGRLFGPGNAKLPVNNMLMLLLPQEEFQFSWICTRSLSSNSLQI